MQIGIPNPLFTITRNRFNPSITCLDLILLETILPYNLAIYSSLSIDCLAIPQVRNFPLKLPNYAKWLLQYVRFIRKYLNISAVSCKASVPFRYFRPTLAFTVLCLVSKPLLCPFCIGPSCGIGLPVCEFLST